MSVPATARWGPPLLTLFGRGAQEVKQRAYSAYTSPVGQVPEDKPPATGYTQHSEMLFPQWDKSGSGSGSGSA